MKQLRRFACALVAGAAALSLLAPAAAAESARPAVLGTSYIVMDADTGQVLLEQNADAVSYPASITKIMILGLAAQKAQGDWNVELTVTHDDVYSLENGSSHIALQPDEVVKLEDMFYATELASANDGANVLAEYVGGSIQGGVDAMNAQAAALGLANTHYVNPHGLHDDAHYTTARDMAVITRWALQQPRFEDFFCFNQTWTMHPTNIQAKERYFSTDDWMRLSGKYYRDYAKGSKSGFHDQARYTMVNYAEQNGVRLISVELGCPQRYDKFKDACALLDYCFANYSRVEIPAGEDVVEVPLYGGGEKQLGTVKLQPVAASVLLHSDFGPGDVAAEYSIPEKYVLGQPFSASVRFKLVENSLQPSDLGGENLTVSGLPEIMQANTYIPAGGKAASGEAAPGTIVAVAAVAIAAVAVFWLLRARRPRPFKRSRKSGYGAADITLLPLAQNHSYGAVPARSVRRAGQSSYDRGPTSPRR